MSRTRHGFARSFLASPYFWVSVALESLLVILAAAEVPVLPFALLGAGILVGVLVLAFVGRLRRSTRVSEAPTVPPVPEDQRELARLSRVIGEVLATVGSQPEGAHKDAVTRKLVALGVQFRAVGSGTGAIGGTESWYVAHDAILTIPHLKEYRALVQVRDSECARDPILRESLQAAFAAVRRGALVERILVLPDALWPAERLLPADDIWPWIEEQHNHWVRVILLRQSALPPEPEFALDTCVFDDWGVGTRDLDDRSQTACVALDFTRATVRAALDRLDRLSNLGISVRELLDRAERAG